MTKLYTAAEIVEMKLPNLPSTKRAIQLRAEKEEWHFETKVGLGGVRKVFEIPEAYLPGYKALEPEMATSFAMPNAVRIARAARDKLGATIDVERLRHAIRFLEAYLEDNNLSIAIERKSEIIVVLYNYLETHNSKEEVAQLLNLVA
ncbi:hypothetical protein [Undibacterium sp. TC9W]|uniref:hypothetical protein n=1 Tax=Undibacterium sp. TC9W TaxID=3413053 RepID=UPI003BF3ABA6